MFEPVDAVEVIPAGCDDTEQWHSQRAKGIGASEILACTGDDEYITAHRLWLSKRRPVRTKSNAAMRHGTLMEPIVAELFSEATGIDVFDTGMWARLDSPHHQCSPDRFTGDGGGLEIKTTKEYTSAGVSNVDTWREAPPWRAVAQAQWCMHVTGATHWWVTGWIYGHDLFVHRVARDQDIIDMFALAADDMWEYVTTGIEPPAPMDSSTRFQSDLNAAYEAVDGSVVENEALAELTSQHKLLSAQRGQLDESVREITASIKLMLGDATEGIADGRTVVTWRPNRNGNRVLSVK